MYMNVAYFVCLVFYRNLVSASQDGKLIVWDGYTTNKVLLKVLNFYIPETVYL